MTDAKALAERLRDALRDFAIGHEAADMIEQQAAEITRLDARRAAIYSAEQARARQWARQGRAGVIRQMSTMALPLHSAANTVLAELVIPADITREEAERLCALLRMAVLPEPDKGEQA